MRAELRLLPICLWTAVLAACAAGERTSRGEVVPDHSPVATSSAGMVVTGSSYATEAGLRMLEMGGNAVDAAVAAAFGLAVAEPTQSGLGGRSQILIRLVDGSVHGIDGTTEVPASYDPERAPQGEHGHGAVGIPGTVAALTRAHAEHGTLPLATIVDPARGWARDGMVLSEGEAGRLAGLAPELDPASEIARLFTAGDGLPLAPGALVRQPELASVLDAIAREGRDGFYTGEVAERLAADMAANGGFLTGRDLADYRAGDSHVGRGSYRGLELLGSYLPASGVTVIEILQILDRLELPQDDPGWAATLAEALLAGFADRETAEHRDAAEAVAWLTSDSLADRRAEEARARLGGGTGTLGAGAFDDGSEPAFTTHVSVADTFGNVVALTQSLGPTGGARVVTPGLGFVYASTLGGYLSAGEPGYRPWSSQAPLIVLREGRPAWVMGGAGSRRILSALVATLTRLVDQGLPLDEAMAAPRLHPTGDQILVEEGWPAAGGLAERGYDVAFRERVYFARLNVVELRPDRTFLGVAEPRWIESAAAGPDR